jgi:hypothetical protein
LLKWGVDKSDPTFSSLLLQRGDLMEYSAFILQSPPPN